MHNIKFHPETEEWKFRIRAEFVLKPVPEIKCTYCNGKGKYGGGFKSIDGPQQCPECFGSGKKIHHAKTLAPSIPEDLTEHMKKAYDDWLENHNHERQWLKLP